MGVKEQLYALAAIYVALAPTLIGAGVALDAVFGKAYRRDVVRRMRRLNFTTVPWIVARSFTSALDRIFGTRHVSWRCVAASAAASVLYTSLLFGLFVAIRGVPWGIDEIFSTVTTADGREALVPNFGKVPPIPWYRSSIFRYYLQELLTGLLVINLIADYLALMKTRLVVRRIADRRLSAFTATLVVLADAVASLALGVIGLIAFTIVNATWLPPEIDPPSIMSSVQLTLSYVPWFLEFGQGAWLPPPDQPHDAEFFMFLFSGLPHWTSGGVWLYSTLLASVWLWLHLSALVILRVSGALDARWKWFTGALEAEVKPFTAAGVVAAAMAAPLFALMALFVLFG